MTAERFAQLVVSDAVVNRIRDYRARLPELDRLKQEIKSREALMEAQPDPKLPLNMQLKGEIRQLKAKCRTITALKSGLPVLMYQATFDKTVSKKGFEGHWRKQSAARLNGLFMLDVDHVGDPLNSPQGGMTEEALSSPLGGTVGGSNMNLSPRELYAKIRQEHPELFSSPQEGTEGGPILLVHVTPSGRGLRFVAIADAGRGNIADNQAWLASQLGVEPDTACKDASRCSFCPMLEDIIYINKENLFTYENKEYDERYGPQYRGENLPPSHSKERGRKEVRSAFGYSTTDSKLPLPSEGAGGEVYRGIPYQTICHKWFELVCKGVPKSGDRHQSLYRLACDLRYITDFDPKLLTRILAECEVGRDIAAERGSAEIERIAADACTQQHYNTIPRRMQDVLRAVGVQLDGGGGNPSTRRSATIDYAAWWHRLEGVLGDSPGYREAVASLPEHHRLAGVLAAGAMFGTYLTRCWWEHFDGKDYRLSFLVYIVGPAASGKSFITELDRLIMEPMRAADRVGREWERQYREDMKKRAASTKNAKSEAPEQQHPVIRYVPSTISNAMLYRRLTDAIDDDCFGPDNQPLHLHCYTLEPELATALRAQTGSWAGKNDLELKSFHNEYAGVDYANDQSVNGIIQVNWNQVVSGTLEAMKRKIKPSTVLDGLVTRLTLFPMPQNDFAMIERRRAIRDHERESYLRSVGLKLEQVRGELKCERLVDFCYQYERQLTDEARLEQDFCLDYFRKRIPVIMMRYTLVRIVLREIEWRVKSGERRVERGEKREESGEKREESGERIMEVIDSDLEFARLIGDWCLMAQMHMFGEMVMEAQEREWSDFVPRKRSTKVREAYARLPETITTETLVSEGVCRDINIASTTLRRWEADGLVKKVDNRSYRKTFAKIPT